LQALNVVFEKIPENESADVCRNISVNVLDCDTIGQAKEKVFQAFLSKNGSPYGLQLNEIGLGKFRFPPTFFLLGDSYMA
jgi:plexin C